MNSSADQNGIEGALLSAFNMFQGNINADVRKDIVLYILFWKYISDVAQYYDDEIKKRNDLEEYNKTVTIKRFILPCDTDFYSIYKKRHEFGNAQRIMMALYAIEEANENKFKTSGKSIFQAISFSINELGDEKQKDIILCNLLEIFSQPMMGFNTSIAKESDEIGNIYEYLLDNFAANDGRIFSDSHTPPKVGYLITRLLDPQPNDSICDPTCGSGSLLVHCAKQIKAQGSNDFSLYGQEVNSSVWAIAKINMFLHNLDTAQIEWGDTIRNPKLLDGSGNLKLFDIVTANPPFGLSEWGYNDIKDDKFDRFQRGIPPKTKCDYAFILHMIETIKPKTGRMSVIVPLGVLFRGAIERVIRKQLIEENILDAVIGLPAKLFYNFSIPVAVLLFKASKVDANILFIDASRDFEAAKNFNLLTDDHVNRIFDLYKKRQTINKFAYLSSLDEIRANDYNLNISRYIDTYEYEEKMDPVVLYAEHEKLKEELSELEKQMLQYLNDIGFPS